jgi:hypothetical protein
VKFSFSLFKSYVNLRKNLSLIKENKVTGYKVEMMPKSSYVKTPFKWKIVVVPLSTLLSNQQDEVVEELKRDFPADYKLGLYENKDEVDVVAIYKTAVMNATDDEDADDTQDEDVENIPPCCTSRVLVIPFGRFKRKDDQSNSSNFMKKADGSETKMLFRERMDTLNTEVSKMPQIVANMNGGVLFENGEELVDCLLVENNNWLKYKGDNRTQLKTKLKESQSIIKGKLENKGNIPRGNNKLFLEKGLQEIIQMIKCTDKVLDGKYLPDHLEKE